MATIKQQKRWQYELAIIQDLGRIPSCREMVDLLLEKYHIKVNHNTVNSDLKKDLESLTDDQLLNKKESLVKKLEDELEVAHGIAQHSEDDKLRLDAMKTVSKLTETISRVYAIFQKAQAEINKENQPIYNVSIGEAELVDEQEFKKMEKKKDDKDKGPVFVVNK